MTPSTQVQPNSLPNARLLTTDEAMRALSLVRLGVVTGLIRPADVAGLVEESGAPKTALDVQMVNSLLLFVQPAHLQRVVGRDINQEQRRIARAARTDAGVHPAANYIQ